MKKYFVIVFLTLIGTGLLWFFDGQKTVESAPIGPELIIVQVKITSSNGQFVTLYNNTSSPIDLSAIQLQYFNSFNLLKATSGKLISLSGKVPAHGYVVVNDGPIQACYQMNVNSVSLGLSSTTGFIQVSHFLGTTSPQFISFLDDYVGWSKTPATGAQTLPANTNAFLQRKALDGSQNYSSINTPGLGSWSQVNQADDSAPCDQSGGNIGSGASVLSTNTSPIPFRISGTSEALSSIPADDNGLAAPQISEVLPNPAPPQTDANDEFVELYNPNDKAFDLGGFMVQVGTTTLHKYTFTDGTNIEPHKFTAFYASDTNLSLSNSDGQVKLLDPGGNVLGETDEYVNAKDGYAWVKADGLWQWTTSPTPNGVNVITSPPVSSQSSSSSKKKLKGATAAAGVSGSGGSSGTPAAASLHPLVLAGIGTAAVVYALYEYRNDLANQFYKFRRNKAARETFRQTT